MITCLIRYKQSPLNFSVLLSQLQPQLHPDDDIFIFDESPNRLGLRLSLMYGTNRSYINVETSPHKNYLKSGLESMNKNNQQALIVLNENCFVSSTFIPNMKKAITTNYEIVSPVVNFNEHYKMDSNFKFYNQQELLIEDADDFSPECFMITRDGDRKYGTLLNEYLTVLRPNPLLKLTTEGDGFMLE